MNYSKQAIQTENNWYEPFECVQSSQEQDKAI